MPTLTTNQKIALAFSIPIAGILFYFLSKWRQEDSDDEVGIEDEFVSSAELVSEMQIPQCHVGAIIGRGGCVIKQIQKESDTRINFKDDNEESEDDLTEEEKQQVRTVVIRGSRERIKHAEVLIKKLIDEQPVLEKAVAEIPELAIGRIIGKGGKTIRQLCRISGAKIKFDQDNETSKIRTCDITGTKAQIECAKQLIDEKIAEDEEFRRKKRKTQEVKNKLTFSHLPVHGDYFAVYVSAMDTPGHFWIQNISSDAKQLDDLVEEMTQFYGDKGRGKLLTPPKVGDICCATFQHDESWYRSEIVKVMEEKNQVRVQYLDFGDSDVVSMSNVKEIREEYCTLPFQAIECYLANVKPAGEDWSREASDMFEKFSSCAQWKVLMARVIYYDDNGVPCIELIDTNTEEDVNIEGKLVEQGFAVYREQSAKNETENNSKTSVTKRSEPAEVDKIVAEQREIALKQMNEEFRFPAFENASFEMNESESFEFSSPISSQSRNSEKKVVNEPPIASVEHQVVSCADISQLNSMFEMLNVDSSTAGADISHTENMKDGDGRGEHDSSDHLTCEQKLQTEDIEEKQEEDLANPVSMNLDENVNSETPISSSVDAQESFMESITISNFQSTGSADFMPDILSSSNAEMVNDTREKRTLKDEINRNKDVPLLFFANDHPITSTPEYHPNPSSKTIVKKDATKQKENGSVLDYGLDRAHDGAIREDYGFDRADNGLEAKQNNKELDQADIGVDQPDYVLRRSYSEDLTRDDALTHDGLIKCSSEITVIQRKDNTVQDSTNTHSLGSLSSGTPKGKRVLAANFSQILNNSRHQQHSEDDESDNDSLYLSAKEDSDSTGFFSAVGSRSNLRNDADSDVTPSGYLSESEDNSIEIAEDQTRFDTTLLVEKLEQYADGK